MASLLKKITMKTNNFPFLSIILICGILLFYSCKKEVIEPDSESEPEFYIRGNLDGDTINFTAGVPPYYAISSVIDNDTNRTFCFQMYNNPDSCNPLFVIAIYNYSMLLGNIENDLDNTIKVGDYNYYQLSAIFEMNSRVLIMYNNQNIDTNSSLIIDQPNCSFVITKTENIVTNDNKKYKKAYINFNCFLKNEYDNSPKEFKNGKAVIAFEYQ